MGEFNRNITDADLVFTGAMPEADGTSYTDVFHLGDIKFSAENMELEIVIPAMTTTHLPDDDTLTVSLVHGTTATPTAELFQLRVFTGAGGAGSAGETIRFRLPSTVDPYIRLKAVAAGGTGDISGLTMSLTPLF